MYVTYSTATKNIDNDVIIVSICRYSYQGAPLRVLSSDCGLTIFTTSQFITLCITIWSMITDKSLGGVYKSVKRKEN